MAVSLYLYTALGGVERYIFPYYFLLLLCKTFALLLLLLLFPLGRYFVDFSIAQKVLQANFLWILFCLIIGYGHTAFAIVFSDFWGAKLLTWLQSKKSNSIDFAFGDSSIFNLRPLLYLECVRELNRSSQVFAKFHWPLYLSIYLSPLLLLLLLLLFSSVSLRLLWFTLRFGLRTLRWFWGGEGKVWNACGSIGFSFFLLFCW